MQTFRKSIVAKRLGRRAAPMKIVVYGAGGHAKSVLSVIHTLRRYAVVGLIEDHPARVGAKVLGEFVIGGPEVLPGLTESGLKLAAVAIGDNIGRKKISASLASAGLAFPTIRHPSSWVVPGSDIGDGSFIHAFSSIGPDCRIGHGVIVSANAVVGHDTTIEDWSHIAPGVRIGGRATIREGAFLGMGACILPGVKVGMHAKVGANAVVHKDIPDRAIVVGNPARPVPNLSPEAGAR